MTRLSTFAEQRLPAQSRCVPPTQRPSPLWITLLAGVAALLPADATAQYWSLGISFGGGTTVAAHMGMHLGNTDDRRESGLTGGRTEVELVIGLSRFERENGGKIAKPSFGLNLRKTERLLQMVGVLRYLAPATDLPEAHGGL